MRLAVVGACAVVAGCQPTLTEVRVTQDTTPPLEHAVSSDGFTITHGSALAITLTAFNEEGEQEDGEIWIAVDVEGEENVSLEVLERGYDYHSTQFVLIGESPGSGSLRVSSELTVGELDIPYTVLAQ